MAKGSSLLRLLMVIFSVFACLYTAGRYVLSWFLLHTSEILRSVNSLSNIRLAVLFLSVASLFWVPVSFLVEKVAC
jgi:hypothetical protein